MFGLRARNCAVEGLATAMCGGGQNQAVHGFSFLDVGTGANVCAEPLIDRNGLPAQPFLPSIPFLEVGCFLGDRRSDRARARSRGVGISARSQGERQGLGANATLGRLPPCLVGRRSGDFPERTALWSLPMARWSGGPCTCRGGPRCRDCQIAFPSVASGFRALRILVQKFFRNASFHAQSWIAEQSCDGSSWRSHGIGAPVSENPLDLVRDCCRVCIDADNVSCTFPERHRCSGRVSVGGGHTTAALDAAKSIANNMRLSSVASDITTGVTL